MLVQSLQPQGFQRIGKFCLDIMRILSNRFMSVNEILISLLHRACDGPGRVQLVARDLCVHVRDAKQKPEPDPPHTPTPAPVSVQVHTSHPHPPQITQTSKIFIYSPRELPNNVRKDN